MQHLCVDFIFHHYRLRAELLFVPRLSPSFMPFPCCFICLHFLSSFAFARLVGVEFGCNRQSHPPVILHFICQLCALCICCISHNNVMFGLYIAFCVLSSERSASSVHHLLSLIRRTTKAVFVALDFEHWESPLLVQSTRLLGRKRVAP